MSLPSELPASDTYSVDLKAIVAQAIMNVRARGIEPHPDVIALYGQYAEGKISREQVSAIMNERAICIQKRVMNNKREKDLNLEAV